MNLAATELAAVFLGLAVLLLVSKALGELARRLGHAAVIGELGAGILLGPTVFGGIFPELAAKIFPKTGAGGAFFSVLQGIGVLIFLLTAGTETHLSRLRQHARAAIWVSAGGVILPFAIGFTSAHYGHGFFAGSLAGPVAAGKPLVLELFFATALAISALPVIAKVLMDLGLLRSEIGVVTMAAAILDDLAGWLIFACVLGLATLGSELRWSDLAAMIGLTLLFSAAMLVGFRPLIHRMFGWLRTHTPWPSTFVTLSIVCAFIAAAMTEWIGVHGLFGAFIAGVAIADSDHADEAARKPLEEMSLSFFAPLFFAMIGLRVDFIRGFDGPLIAVVLAVACLGKVLGCGIMARIAGLEPAKAWSVGFAMNARGAMEIVLGLAAFQAGLISEKLFVALVVMALVTSLMSAPVIRWLLRREQMREIEHNGAEKRA